MSVLALITVSFLVTLKLSASWDTFCDNELEVIIETAEGKYKKDLVYLNDYTMYVVEDVSGANVDKYHYEINFLPEWGAKITHKN